jgi:Domain of unknown function (DUF397)
MTNQAAVNWRRSSFSNGGGNCVECAALPGSRFAIRDSKSPGAAMLSFSGTGMSALLESVTTMSRTK